MAQIHNYHIPVMGLGFTIDTPINVAHFGIDSVVSIGDDILIEKIRKYHCDRENISYTEISEKEEDYRARRITSYLNLLNTIVEKNFKELKSAENLEDDNLMKLIELLPTKSKIRLGFIELQKQKEAGDLNNEKASIKELLKELKPGSIDVNIMAKADKPTYKDGVQLPLEFNNAHTSLRGFAMSDLSSSMVFSAGMNPRLYTYLESFKDFYPDEKGFLKKKIVIKVSDFRSAVIQGKILAKKGLWVSEFRIESGLNCGGHAFATEGLLMGPILDKFKNQKSLLEEELSELYITSLKEKNISTQNFIPQIKYSAQGGVGTSAEHQFLLEEYDLNSIGWGSPFLLVPEVCRIDEDTMKKLIDAEEKDLYLSNISPFGVPFNNIRGNTKDLEKQRNAEKGRPGSACPKDYLSFDTEFDEKGLCTASRKYQHLKIKQLDEDENISEKVYQYELKKIQEKACLCVGLGTSPLLRYGIDHKTEGEAVSVCPGPNIAYFNKELSLVEMSQHIYGRLRVLAKKKRPHMFIKELQMYLDFLDNKMEDYSIKQEQKDKKYIIKFQKNMKEGISYYMSLFKEKANAFLSVDDLINSLKDARVKVETINLETDS